MKRIIARFIALSLLICFPVLAQNISTPVGNNGVPIQAIQLGASQNVSYAAAGGTSATSSAFGANTRLIQISVNISSTDSGIRIATGSAPIASSTTTLIPASGVYYFAVGGGQKVAVLSDNATTGTINVTEAVSQ